MTRLPPSPTLAWEGAVPRAERFSDLYFSRAGGLSESEAVFLAGCGLPEAWRGRRSFTIVELGFGTGLNALAAWRLWSSTRPPGAILHFCSIEAAPLDAPSAARALSAFPEIAPYAERLLRAWPVSTRGPQRIWLADEFALTLLVGEAEKILGGFAGRADAWFLDGFAPDRNPDMWSEALLRRVAACSAPGARLATYSVAGAVRRNLAAAGFAVEKKPGFAAKRERLEAVLTAPAPAPQSPFPYEAADGQVAILGGGVAGATLAHALRRRGRDCVIVDAPASKSPAALVMPQLDRGRGVQAEWRLAAFLAAVRLYEELGLYTACGASEKVAAAAFADFAQDPPLPPDWLGAEEGRLLHRKAGVVDPAALLAALTRRTPRIDALASRIEPSPRGWRLFDADGRVVIEAPVVALCCGARLASFAQTDWLPVRLTRGQLEFAPDIALASAHIDDGYAAPASGGVVFGATFDRIASPEAPAPDAASRAKNVATLARLAPHARQYGEHDRHGERMVSFVGVRAATPDHAPLVGLMPDAPAWRTQYAALRHGRRDDSLTPPALHGLYVFGCLGARGFTHAPFLAERLAAEINGELPAGSQSLIEALHPARFLLRSLKRDG
ncbi:MAG: tRNA (5-methylaminomethyl-2-thiouridine)(34)-methyltransferase MnmD [Hyphomonadaceae bacterium]|nr:tRNA (5-methylaminomethyl-2-thiouridine)(34)-methyltransferase MnmD [Hyphomonadaceae bacterium]